MQNTWCTCECKAYRNAGGSIWAVTTGAFESRIPAGWYAFIHCCHACGCVLLSWEVHLKGCTNAGGLLVLDEPQEVKPLLEILRASTHKLHCLDVQQTIYHVLEISGKSLYEVISIPLATQCRLYLLNHDSYVVIMAVPYRNCRTLSQKHLQHSMTPANDLQNVRVFCRYIADIFEEQHKIK